MNPDPDLIHYACIAKGTTVLAEFNSKDAALGAIAAKCLAETPSFHATFTHTVRSMTYTFLIDEPVVYFAIFDEKLETAEGLAFLRIVRDAFGGVSKGLSPQCYQGEFNPVFRQLLGSGLAHTEGIGSPRGQRLGESGVLQYGSGSVRGRQSPNAEKELKKMKSRLLGEFNFGRRSGVKREENDDVGGTENENGNGNGSSGEFSMMNKRGGLYSGELLGHQHAKRIWKKQVWFILSLDLIICVVLFVVWLWICSGFKCIHS